MPLPPASQGKSIVLVGLMGAGKSTLGRRLARRLGLPFADADSEIEHAADRTITEIFDSYGEAAFRDGERRVIERLVNGPRQVIATGGGAFMDERTRALILERCIAVWLDADLDLLAERVARRSHRPLLHGREPRAVLSELAAARNPIYAQSHIHMRSEDSAHDQAVDEILAALSAWKGR